MFKPRLGVDRRCQMGVISDLLPHDNVFTNRFWHGYPKLSPKHRSSSSQLSITKGFGNFLGKEVFIRFPGSSTRKSLDWFGSKLYFINPRCRAKNTSLKSEASKDSFLGVSALKWKDSGCRMRELDGVGEDLAALMLMDGSMAVLTIQI